MIKVQILKLFATLTPIEKMEVCLELQIKIMEDTGSNKTDPALFETLQETLKGLKHG